MKIWRSVNEIRCQKTKHQKSVKARTSGKIKRQVKKSVNPLYGQTGMGIVNDPKKAAYNAVYNKTTVGVDDLLREKAKETNDTNSSMTSGDVFRGIGSFFSLIFALLKLAFWLAVLAGIIAFVVWIIRL